VNIETKFNLDDHAWYMKNNVPTEVIISSIKTFNVGTNQDSITYTAKDTVNSVSWLDHEHLHEGILFSSKIALSTKLFGTECKGPKCSALNGIGHSKECMKEHDSQYTNID